MKKFFTFQLCSLLLISAFAFCSCNNDSAKESINGSTGLTYQLNTQKTGYIVTSMGTCTDTRVVIPDTYNGLPVVEIAEGAFQAEEPPIEELPPAEEGKDKEKEKKLASIQPIEKLSLEAESKENKQLASIQPINETEKPQSLITEVVIPDSVMSIGDAAFYGCAALSSIDTSNLINLIGTDSFKNTAYYLDESNWTDDALYLDEYLVEVRDTASGHWVVREGTINIASSAFTDCVGITSLSLPSSLRFIGNDAFRGCTSLTATDLSFAGIQIGNNAFQGCTSLTTVKIATNDTPNAPPVESWLGAGIDRVNEVFMPGGITEFAFNPKADPTLIYSAYIGYQAFSDCTALTSVTFGSNVGYVGGSAFARCTSLVSMDMSSINAHTPDTAVVTPNANYHWYMSLGRVFEECTSLKEVKLPKGIQYLDQTFINCTSLTEFTIPETVKGLNGTFEFCSGLTSITIPEGVVALSETFYCCENLKQVDLPETLTKIGMRTFEACSSLTTLYVPDAVTEIGWNAFYGMDKADVSIGSGVKSIGRVAVTAVAITYRGTAAEWEAIEKDERWSQDGSGEYNKFSGMLIFCTDKIIGGEPMEGILLSDGTLYAKYLGVIVKMYPNLNWEILTVSYEEIKAELQQTGTTFQELNTKEIVYLENDFHYNFYWFIRANVELHLNLGEQSNESPSVRPEK